MIYQNWDTHLQTMGSHSLGKWSCCSLLKSSRLKPECVMPIPLYVDSVTFKADTELHTLDIMCCLKLQTAIKA